MYLPFLLKLINPWQPLDEKNCLLVEDVKSISVETMRESSPWVERGVGSLSNLIVTGTSHRYRDKSQSHGQEKSSSLS